MPEGVANLFEPDDFEWHDGNVVDLRFGGFSGERQGLQLTIELFPSDDPQAGRKRYVCIGNGLSRFLVSGDITRLVKRSSDGSFAGNIDFARMDYTAATEILVVVLFGGMIEAEASSAADLKSLHHLLQTRVRDFKSISGTGIIKLPVPFYFSKFVSEVAAAYDELRKEGTSFEFTEATS